MNHNFAPYELTKLLPKVNPYVTDSLEDKEDLYYVWYEYNEYYKSTYPDIILSHIFLTETHSFDEKCIILQDAWTFEDILLWLEEEHKLVIDIITQIDSEDDQTQLLYDYRIISLIDYEQIGNFEYCHSRQEVREKAILECLTLIKNK